MIITRDALAINVTHHRTTKTDHFVTTIFPKELRLTIVTLSKININKQNTIITEKNKPKVKYVSII